MADPWRNNPNIPPEQMREYDSYAGGKSYESTHPPGARLVRTANMDPTDEETATTIADDGADSPSLDDRLNTLSTSMSDNTAALRAGLGLDTSKEAHDWAEKKLQEKDPYAEQEQSLINQYSGQAKNTVARLQAARAKLAGEHTDPRDFWLAMAQGAAMPNTGGKLGWTGNVAGAVRPALAAQHKFTQDQQAGLDQYDTEIEQTQAGDITTQLALLRERRKAWDQEQLRAAQILGKNVPAGAAGQQAPGPKKVDQDYAKDFIDWAQNGQAVAEHGISAIAGVQQLLEQAGASGKTYSGPLKGILPKLGEPGKIVQNVLDPEAVDLRETLENEVQKTLRSILGAAYTSVENQQVISRAYNSQLTDAQNAKRVGGLLTQMRRQYEAKASMARYYATHRTLDGYTGNLFNPLQSARDNLNYLDEYDAALKKPPPPGTIVLTPQQKAAGQPPPAPRAVAPISVEGAPKKDERSFLDRMNPFSSTPQQGQNYADGGPVVTDAADMPPAGIAAPPGQQPDGSILVPLPEGGIARFPAGTNKAQMNAWYQDQKAKEQRKDQLLDLGAAAASGGAGAAAGYGAMRTGEGLAERLPFSPLRIAPGERRMADAANRDQLDLSDAGARLKELQNKFGMPALGVDVLPQESRGLVNEAMRSGTPATADLQAALAGRNTDARANRLPDTFSTVTQADPYLSQSMKLQSDRSAAADPLYAAMRKDPWVPADAVDVNWLMKTSPGREAFDRANTKWMVDKANKGKVPYKAPTQTVFGPNGERIRKEGLPTAYSIDYLDQVKQALDDIEADATGKGYSSADVADMRRRYLEELDAVRPDYAKARMAYREGSKPITALTIGRGGPDVKNIVYQDVNGNMVRPQGGYLDMAPDEAKHYLAGIGGGQELENLRSGVAEALTRQVRSSSAKSNPATAMLGNADLMDNMRSLLDPVDYNHFEASLKNEEKMWNTSDELGRKAESARGKARGAPISTAETLGIEAKNAPGALIRTFNPFSWMYRLTVPSRPIPSQEIGAADKASRHLNSSEAEDIVRMGATTRAEDLERLAAAAGRRATRGRRAGLMGLLGGAAAAGATLYNNAGDEPPPAGGAP